MTADGRPPQAVMRIVAIRATLARRPSPWAAWAVLLVEKGRGSCESLSVPRGELVEVLRAFPSAAGDAVTAEMIAGMSAKADRIPVLVLHNDGTTVELDFADEAELRDALEPLAFHTRQPRGQA